MLSNQNRKTLFHCFIGRSVLNHLIKKSLKTILLLCVVQGLSAQGFTVTPSVPLSADAKAIGKKIAEAYGSDPAVIEDFIYEAQELERHKGIPAPAFIAITILESRGFSSYLFRNSKNPFGMKGWPPYAGKTFTMWHEGEMTPFRAYHNAAEALVDFEAFLRSRKWFKDAFACKAYDSNGFITSLMANKTRKEPGYSADPKWGDKVRSIIQRFELDKIRVTKKPAAKPSTSVKTTPPTPKTGVRK